MIDGKIVLLKTDRVSQILSDANLQFLRKLTLVDASEWWFPIEQVVSVSRIEKVNDGDGRTWVQNQTLLIPIHDYIELTKPRETFQQYFEATLTKLPETYEPIEVKQP